MSWSATSILFQLVIFMVHSHAGMGVDALHFIPVLGQPGTPSNNKLELLPNKTSWVGRIPCGKIASSLTLRALAPLLGTLWFICYKVERVIGSYILIERIDNVQICMLENNFRMQDAYSFQGKLRSTIVQLMCDFFVCFGHNLYRVLSEIPVFNQHTTTI